MKEYFIEQLSTLLEQTITIHTINNQKSISGVLINIQKDYITLVIKPGEIKQTNLQRSPYINFRKAINVPSTKTIVPGIIAEIPISSITSVYRYAI
ncbi:uncharacterized protein DUF2642 [Natranaerovirga pectinivora]|uniref:Uncharacterized protein DUF2642 n=1 Tax=Natranaerovirga pectinivora TaxID=682400 RepID=A0A4R3MRK1_9FIRM|nr:DUF2642 domain-containing protein [Natranaerovirga pectinivora]TCT16818.1 uncharacterized protein DUF2642 [Natranaerovirga pectinivora]